MFCEKCGKEMQGAFCTNCGWKKETNTNSSAKTKKPIYKKWWFWVIIVVVLLLMIGSNGNNSNNNVEIKTDNQNQVENVVMPKVGETFTTDKFEITVTDVVEKSRVGSTYVSSTPADGGTYVCVQFKYKNISNEPISSWKLPDIKLVNEENVEYSPDISASSYYATEVDPNRKVLSDLNPQITTTNCKVFEVSKEIYASSTWRLFVNADKDVYVEI